MRVLYCLVLLALSCGGNKQVLLSTPRPKPQQSKVEESITLSLVGTNDFHGSMHMLPWLGGYLNNLRAEERPVLLLDAGDMFQGTLESNLGEGDVVVQAYNALNYDAVAIGNHEFDFGPVGSDTTVKQPTQNPRGALLQRASEAHFPFLSANILLKTSNERPDWKNVYPHVLIEKAGIKIGIIGATTEGTPWETIATNVADLKFSSIASAIEEQAAILKGRGADFIVVTVHEGGACDEFHDPKNVESCETDAPIMEVARKLNSNLVQAIVAGHTHRGMAHVVNGIAIIESFAQGVAFGRIDFTLRKTDKRILGRKIYPPQQLCKAIEKNECMPFDYAGKSVSKDISVEKIVSASQERAAKKKNESLGVYIKGVFFRSRSDPSPLSNLFADYMLKAHPEADAALINNGAIRSNLNEGTLTYGQLYEAHPFDNSFVMVTLTAKQLKTVIKKQLEQQGSFISFAGITIKAFCRNKELQLSLTSKSGKTIKDTASIHLVTSNFVANGGGAFLSSLDLPADSFHDFEGQDIRESIAQLLKKQGGTLDAADPKLFDPKHPRIEFEGKRPLICH
ncbi:MAG: bifunctional metallophosphatase/5'-nucleotidase [Myxococcales bacterium]|nr:MAG: bifunctional metallophosphatase/5'-nucleotidase [Myxococcales bacterium]